MAFIPRQMCKGMEDNLKSHSYGSCFVATYIQRPIFGNTQGHITVALECDAEALD